MTDQPKKRPVFELRAKVGKSSLKIGALWQHQNERGVYYSGEIVGVGLVFLTPVTDRAEADESDPSER